MFGMVHCGTGMEFKDASLHYASYIIKRHRHNKRYYISAGSLYININKKSAVFCLTTPF